MSYIGLDFDNTIIDYDQSFYFEALNLNLIPNNITKSKVAVRKYLIDKGMEEKFTSLQGKVYGQKINNAAISLGVMDALKSLKKKGHEFIIVSHKTKYPIKGDKYNLHEAALEWLKNKNFIGSKGLDIKRESIYFEPTIEKKIKRIFSSKCRYFIDDLESILDLLNNKIIKIHYDKNSINNYEKINQNFVRINNWDYLNKINFK